MKSTQSIPFLRLAHLDLRLCARLFVFILGLAFSYIQASSQSIELNISHFNVQDGLSDHRTIVALEHSNGYVYIGTWNGVSRFDGYSFSHIKATERDYNNYSFTQPMVISLGELDDGRLLIFYRSATKGIVEMDIYDSNTGVNSPLQFSGLDMDNARITIAGKQHTFRFSHRKAFDVYDKIEDLHGNYFIQDTIQGKVRTSLHLASGESKDISEFWDVVAKGGAGINGADFSNTFYIPSHNGIVKVDVDKFAFKTYLSDSEIDWEYATSARAIAFVGKDSILFSTEQDDLIIFNRKSRKSTIPTFKNKDTGEIERVRHTRRMFVVNDSIVWYPSYEGFLLKLNLKALTFGYDTINNGERCKIITSCQLDEDHILMGLSYELPVSPSRIENYLILYNTKTSEELNFDFAQDFFEQDYHRITCMLPSKSGMVWVGTTLGLYLFDLENESIAAGYFGKAYANDTSSYDFPCHYVLNSRSAYDLYENEKNEMLIGLDGGGLDILDLSTNRCKSYTTENGLASNKVCSIEPDSTGYWLGTFNGLSHFDVSSQTFRNFTRANGLPHNEMNRFAHARDVHGSLFFGGMNGFFSFDANEILNLYQKPRILLSSVSSYMSDSAKYVSRPFAEGQEAKFTIPAANRACNFTLAMTSMHNPDGHQYSYQLDNKAEEDMLDWQSVGKERTLSFSYLPAGEYDLKIKGTSSQGSPTDVFTIKLIVEEYFYKTWWFTAICALALILIVYIIYRVRVAQVVKVERLKNQLSSDLHDDVGSVLSGVAYQMELLAYSVGDEHKPLAKRVAESSRKAMYQMRDVVWAINANNSSVVDLSERMKEFSREQLEPLGIQCIFELDEPILSKDLSSEIRHSTLLIFKEFVTNTIKHAEANRVVVSLSRQGKTMVLQCNDDGKGMVSQDYTGQGLMNMKNRTKKLKGTIEFLHEKGFGIKVKIPLT